jgi:hypothetical protein
LSKSFHECAETVSEELAQADHDTLICLVGKHLDADLEKNENAPATSTASQGRPNKTPFV